MTATSSPTHLVDQRSPAIGASGRRWLVWLVVATGAFATGMFVVGMLVTSFVAGGHAQFHALFALAVLAPALAISIRAPRGTPLGAAPVIGLLVLAVTQLIEGVGGFGYGPGNDVRVNDLAQVHDLGLGLAPLGLIAGLAGVLAGLWATLARRVARPVAVALFAVAAVAGVLGLKLMIGL